jgi:hypothetical protein
LEEQEVSPDNNAAISFLKKWSPTGPWTLTSISTDRKGINTTTFRPDSEGKLKSWLKEYNGQRNIYFSVNTPNRDITKKAEKEDIGSAEWLHVDVDPAEGGDLKEEREKILSMFTDKLPKGIPDPTVIIFSGGGYQAFWRLKDAVTIDGNIEKAETFELYNKRLEQIFGGDHCHNVDRIMRLPGTVNIPDAKKLKKGRTKALAFLLQFSKAVYDIKEFKPAQDVQLKGEGSGRGNTHSEGTFNIPGNVERIQDLSELDKWEVGDRLKVVIAQGSHPDQPKKGDNSRSAWLFDCVCGLIRCNVPDEVIFSILTDPDWGISSSVIEMKGGAAKYAARQIMRAKEFSEDPHLTMMNDRHAIIGNIGGKCRVIEEIDDDILKRSRLTMSSFEDLRNRYSNIRIPVGTTDKGLPVLVPLGKYWLDHKMRRQFDTMKFMPQGDLPGVYNLWRGFSFEPRPGDCSMYLEHLKQNVCSGVEAYYEYLIHWMARTVQFPASPGEVAIVMRGGKGTGKSVMATVFGRLFGRHNLHVANPSHLVGNFNAHLRDVIVLFADEAFFAGDKKHESVLKMLITEDSIPIEAKGVDVETYPNYVHLIMAANDPHVIRASGDERRYFVLEVGEGKKQDKKYFADMFKQMEDGGYEALLYYLQEIDLEGFQVRDVPTTDALQEQKMLSMSVDEEWWFRKIQNGRILDSDDKWYDAVPCDSLINDFTAYAEKWKFNRRGNETSLGRFLSRVCPHVTREQKRISMDERDPEGNLTRVTKRGYFYDFGSLESCRASWEKLYGKTNWQNAGELDLKVLDVPF